MLRDMALRTLPACVFLLLTWGAMRPLLAQTQIVSPEAVTTPSAAASWLPTPTPDARATAPDLAHFPASSSYVVQAGDTLWSVSLEIGVDLATMPCVISPTFRTDQALVIGDALALPPAGMICHQVEAGETLGAIASRYGVDPADLSGDGWNRLDAAATSEMVLEAGRYVRILPRASAGQNGQGGFLTYMLSQPVEVAPFVAYAVGGPQTAPAPAGVPANWPYGSGYFNWPTTGWVSQGYRQDHRALDIAAPLGTSVTAADRGVVVRAGWNQQGYGFFVVIDHNIDYLTLYSHLQDVYVNEGDIVAQGQAIGAVGSTGNSTGPHLHFEVRDFGSRINPLEVLLR